MGRMKQRKRKKSKPAQPRKRIRWNWMTLLVYVPLGTLAFGIILAAPLMHVWVHPDIYHVATLGSVVALMVYLSYTAWKAQQ